MDFLDIIVYAYVAGVIMRFGILMSGTSWADYIDKKEILL